MVAQFELVGESFGYRAKYARFFVGRLRDAVSSRLRALHGTAGESWRSDEFCARWRERGVRPLHHGAVRILSARADLHCIRGNLLDHAQMAGKPVFAHGESGPRRRHHVDLFLHLNNRHRRDLTDIQLNTSLRHYGSGFVRGAWRIR